MNKISIREIKTTLSFSNNFTLSKEVDKTSALKPQRSKPGRTSYSNSKVLYRCLR